MIIKKLIGFIRAYYLVLILIAVFGFFFFYRLDYQTLTSWDEAWYGSISREMVKSGDWMRMKWNGKAYYDHPPMGFWLMATSYKLLGINEFTTRLPSALVGTLTISFIYLTANLLFKNKYIGFVSGLVMGTCVWYFIRVRSGNLDSVFAFFYILTVYLSIKASINFRWFPLAMAAFGALILSKTLVGFSAGALIVFLNFQQIIKPKNIFWLLLGVGVAVFVVYPWYFTHMKTNPLFIQEHFVNIGTRNKSPLSYFQLNTALPLFYLHMGVRKWYYLWLLAVGSILVTLKLVKKSYMLLFLWNFVILYPFLTSDKTQIWHLIPVYLPMSLIIASGLFLGGETLFLYLLKTGGHLMRKHKKTANIIKKLQGRENLVVTAPFLIFFVILTTIQVKGFYKEVFPGSRYVPDDVDISKRVGKYRQKIFLDDDFLPIAVFYSSKPITTLISLPDEKKSMVKLFESNEQDFVMITRNWAVDGLKAENLPYKILEKNNSFSIVSRP